MRGVHMTIRKRQHMTVAPRNDDLLTVSEVAQQLRVDDTTVRRWIKSGALQAVRLPKKLGSNRNSYRVRRETLHSITTETPE